MLPQPKPAGRIEFGRRLKAARHEPEWTQERLAEASGLHPTYVGDSERGERNVSLDNILRPARALGLDAGALMGGPPRPAIAHRHSAAALQPPTPRARTSLAEFRRRQPSKTYVPLTTVKCTMAS